MRGEYEEKLSHEILILLFLSLSMYLPKLLFLVCSRQTQKKNFKKNPISMIIWQFFVIKVWTCPIRWFWDIDKLLRWTSHIKTGEHDGAIYDYQMWTFDFSGLFFAYLHSWLSLNFFFWCELANIELKKKRKVRCFAMLIRKCVIYLHDEFKLNIENLKCS